MADNEIKIPITVEGAEQAARQIDGVERQVTELGQAAQTASPQVQRLSTATSATARSTVDFGRALNQNREHLSRTREGLSSLATSLGGQTGLVGRIAQGTQGVLGLAGALASGPLGLVTVAAAAATGLGTLTRMLAGTEERLTSTALRAEEAAGALGRVATAQNAFGNQIEAAFNRRIENDPAFALERVNAQIQEIQARNSAGGGLVDSLFGTPQERAAGAEDAARMAQLLEDRADVERRLREANRPTGPTGGGGGRRVRPAAQAATASDEDAFEAENFAALMDARRQMWAEEAAALEQRKSKEEEVAEAQRQTARELAELSTSARDDEIAAIMATDERLGLDMQRRDIEAEIARLRSDQIPDTEQAVDFERTRLRLMQNSRRETSRQREDAEASAQELGNYGSLLGQVFADAYGSAINGQKDFGAAFAESMKGILAQLGTKYIVEGAAALFQAIGFAASYQYKAAAGKAVEGAGLVALGAGLGAVGAAIPSASVTPTAPEKPESPDSGSGSEQSIQRTVVINYNSPVVTAGTRRQLGDQMSSLIRSGSRS